MMRLLCLLLLLTAWPAPATTAEASPSVQTDHLQSRLVSEMSAAVPGTQLTLGLLFEHDLHWHTYWRNPGDSGLPTALELALPAGVTAEPIAWPRPQRFEFAGIVNFGYSGRRLLPVVLTIPAAYTASSLQVRAAANWLICEVECIPGHAEYALDLPVAQTAAVEPRWVDDFSATRSDLPRVPPARVEIAEHADAIEITLSRLDDGASPGQWLWFPETPEVVANGATPQWQRTAEGWQARWPKSEYFTVLPGDVALVAVDGNGAAWRFATRIADAALTPVAAAASEAATPVPHDGPEPLSLLPALLLAFIGGLVLNLMPCVFPVLSMKAMGALGSAGNRAELRRHGGWYTLGVVATFLFLACALLALRAAGQQLGWGFHLQEPRFVAGVALLLFGMALSFSGVWEFGGRFTGAGQRLTEGHGARASFFTGALAVVVASPCTAPFMGTALGWALAQPVVAALAVFVALGLGLAAPMLSLGLVPGLARALPRPGPWLDGFRQLLAFPLYLTVVWLLWVYGEQTSSLGMAWLLASLTALAFALWLLGRRRAMRSPRLRVAAAVLAAAALVLALGLPLSAPTQDVAGARADNDGADAWSEQRLAQLRADNRPVLVNMTAAWCITCLANERIALSTDAVRKALVEHDVAYLKGDWTRRDEAITRYLQRYGRSGVPLYVLYPSGGGAPRVLPQLLTPDGVVDAIGSM